MDPKSATKTGGHLWAVGYDTMNRAEQVRQEVLRLGEKHALVVFDTAVVVRYPDGSVTLDGEQMVAAIQLGGHPIARFLASLALGAPPLTGAAVRQLVGRTAAEVGISDDFILKVEAQMRPGTSVLFVLDQELTMSQILQEIQCLGGTVLRTNVDVERAKLIQSTLAAGTIDGE
jgi:uncharacterized membrane protein